MCTVSFIATKQNYVFTFNRDEQALRQTPYFINKENVGFKTIYFTKDVLAGGTWFSADSKGNVAMLFNGAFSKHKKLHTYKKSRGVILRNLISANTIKASFNNENFLDTEPFSIILFEDKNLFRLVWDGEKKYEIPLEKNLPYIFSSATLYTDEVQEMRRQWMKDFIKNEQAITSDTVLNFHSNYKKEDKENGLIIYREGSCSTLSISQAVVEGDTILLKHIDIRTGKKYTDQIYIQ
jgi:uncharacterized protein with NRDE domain